MLKLTCLSFGNKNKFICSSDFLFFLVILFIHFLSIICIVARNTIEKRWNFSVVCWLHQTPENVSCCHVFFRGTLSKKIFASNGYVWCGQSITGSNKFTVCSAIHLIGTTPFNSQWGCSAVSGNGYAGSKLNESLSVEHAQLFSSLRLLSKLPFDTYASDITWDAYLGS